MQRNFQLKTAEPGTINLPYTTARYAYQCFPVRNPNFTNDGGAWLVEYKALKQTNNKNQFVRKSPHVTKERKTKDLTGYYIVKNCHADTPDDICILNLSGKNLNSIENEDFSLFKNVVRIDASDNLLTLESFKTFPNLKHLELQVNGITSVIFSHKDFIPLEKLDLSYNCLSHDALLTVGKLRNLCDLSLRGCSLRNLPADLARGYQLADSDANQKKEKAEKKTRFPSLVTLDLSENSLTDISTFASLAGLRKLQKLNLSCNKICSVPHLRLMAAHRHFSMSTCADINSHTRIQYQTSNGANEDLSQNIAKEETTTVEDSSNHNAKQLTDKQLGEENKDSEDKSEDSGDDEDDGNDDLIDGLEDTISRISSTKATGGDGEGGGCDNDETDKLLNIDFAEELNFRLDELDDKDFFGGDLGLQTSIDDDGGGGGIDVDVSEEDRVAGSPTMKMKEDYSAAFHQTSEHSVGNLLDDTLKQPFASLLSIDLSYNHIQNEESLLALATWPLLNELKLWGNPLMRSNKGIPPVLYHHLKVLCGINIIRKEPRPLPRQLPCAPTLATSTKTRKVKDDLPPIKRNNMLAIENMILQAIENKYGAEETASGVDETKQHQDADENEARGGETQEGVDGGSVKQDMDDTFFLTQVDEEGISYTNEQTDGEVTNELPPEGEDEQSLVKYTDINELLRVNEDDDTADELAVPDSVQGSVVALRHMLRNELVFKNGHYNKAKQKNLPKVDRHVLPITQRENSIDEALRNIRTLENGHQENLEVVLENFEDDAEIQRKFPDAKDMLDRVQKKYDKVRSRSLRPLSETQHKLKELSTRADPMSQELVLSRMRKNKIGEVFSPTRGNTARVKVRGTRYDMAISR